MLSSPTYDILIIGSGAAGLGLALSLAEKNKIAIVCKDNGLTSSSSHAQGGIAAVMDQHDSVEAHIADTLSAGAGLCDEKAVEFIVKNGRNAIEWLMRHGVQFTLAETHLHLTQEGGHSHRRVVHAKDQTGAVVVKTLAEQVNEHANIDCFTEKTAIDCLVKNKQCYGATFLNNKTQQIEVYLAKQIVLATGGASRMYLHTSNPGHTTGDGIAMAYRAGCRVANMEFNQFHPTSFYHPHARPFLITEAIRGEGGRLILKNKKRFMPHYDERAEMAPRDIVARAIQTEMQKNHIPCVYLDISHKPAEFIQQFFPTIYAHCLKAGIDMTKEPIPVVPAAHYTCGGIVTNLNGETDIENLYAIGETACTGLHGANRMASNSLLECLVMAMSAAKIIEKKLLSPVVNHFTPPLLQENDTLIETPHAIERVRKLMWDAVGIVRHDANLRLALEKLKKIKHNIEINWPKTKRTKASIEARHIVEVAYLAAFMAQSRHESRGLHFNTDHPNLNPVAQNSVMQLSQSHVSYVARIQN